MAKKTVGSRMTVTHGKAVSRGYCVREFDRDKARAAATQDKEKMQAEQKKYDIHFTGVAYDRRYPVVWCGFTSFVGDLLWTFDPHTKKFASKGFTALREEEEVKIHRGMQVGPDGCVYFGTASLLNLRQSHIAPGGRLFRYDPRRDEYEFLGRPIQGDYIQTIEVDHARGIAYGATYPRGHFFAWDLDKKRLLGLAYIASWPHQVRLDDDGRCWATYSLNPGGAKHPLMYFDPGKRAMVFTETSIPGDGDRKDAVIDSFENGGDGFMYIGADNGGLYRLDPRKVRIELALKPAASVGFGALAPVVNGKLYGIAGAGVSSQVFSYDLASREAVLYGVAYDDKRKTGIFRPHELVMGPNRCLYCPETDNPQRQCYFWEVHIK